VIGGNGAGKTTLFRMIVGDEKPDAGSMRVGETVKLAYVDQSRDALDAEKTVWEEISGGEERMKIGGREMATRAYVSSFNFKGADQQKRVGMLSGGERNRVHLAKLLQSAGNVLLLDEPTNDLDVDTLRALEEGLLGFAGCVVVISHDRWFLDRIATHILAFEGDSHVEWFAGNYQDYEADRKRVGSRELSPRASVGSCNFKGAAQQKRVGMLSGGDRNRLHLAKLLQTGGTVLRLDAPTNDLDVDTLRALEEGLLGFAGCVVVISHDRWFLDRIATHILAFEGDSHVEWFAGNYQDYEADRKRRLGDAADRPSRLTYRKFDR
jgi:ATPase subunit of ABC transporter with duplicated ATPase domains